MNLESKDLIAVKGGGFSATYINAAARYINNVLDFGRTVGSSIRRMISRKWC